MTESLFKQAPVRNESVVGAHVYSHSGEFSPRVVDVALPGRGLSIQFIRKYRSALQQTLGPFGRGWTFTYAKRLEKSKDHHLLYHDGLGRIHQFTPDPATGDFLSPAGLYAILTPITGSVILRQRYRNNLVFEKPEAGGRLLAIDDRNGNTLAFAYAKGTISVTDLLGQRITLVFDLDRVTQLQDHTGRIWHYLYNQDGCLIEIIQPPAEQFPGGLHVRYGYDAAFRLASITDPKDQTFLRNVYDEQGRVTRQEHGSGFFALQYELIDGTTSGFPVYRTEVRQKNGARLLLQHNAEGQVGERTLFVSAESLSPEDRAGSRDATIALTTRSAFNSQGELVERTYPAGNRTTWVYDTENKDVSAQGNLLQMTHIPAPDMASDQKQIVTRYTYEPVRQRLQSVTNPRGYTLSYEYDERGNLVRKRYPQVRLQSAPGSSHPTQSKQLVETFVYNAAGQLIQATDAHGAVTRYQYYPLADPTGARGRAGIGRDEQKGGGYLGRVVIDPPDGNRPLKGKPANLVTEFAYDVYGNIAAVFDGKGNPTRLQHNAQNQLVRITSRAPFDYELTISYDANGNPQETALAFDHNEYDPTQGRVVRTTSTIGQHLEYNTLNRLVRRTLAAGDRELVETFVRDPAENIVRRIQPLGNLTEYRFDERNLLLERRLGAGSRDETTQRYTYTPNGRWRSMTDGFGQTIQYHYDGFHRSTGYTNADGTRETHSLNEVGNITQIEWFGDAGLLNDAGEPIETNPRLLAAARYQYDELDRPVRRDQLWRDIATGQSLGKSNLDGAEGVVSTLVEYADNHLPSKIWFESGNVLSLEYDGANRVISAINVTGESVSISYDENSNPVRIYRLGPEADTVEERVHEVIIQQFDALDRLIARSQNLEPPQAFVYNALGAVMEYENPAQVGTQTFHDAFGRLAGRATTVVTPHIGNGSPQQQLLLQRIEWDENNRLIAQTNAAGHRTRYQYDGINRLVALIYPDGSSRHFQRDANGNVVRILDENRRIARCSFASLIPSIACWKRTLNSRAEHGCRSSAIAIMVSIGWWAPLPMASRSCAATTRSRACSRKTRLVAPSTIPTTPPAIVRELCTLVVRRFTRPTIHSDGSQRCATGSLASSQSTPIVRVISSKSRT